MIRGVRIYEAVVGRVLALVMECPEPDCVEDARIWKGILYSS